MNTLDEKKLLDDLKDPENRKLFYKEHVTTGLPFQIRELRKKRKMTQKHLSEITGFSQPNLSDYENPNYEYTPQIGTLMRLADAFDVPLIVRFGSWDEIWDWETKLSPKKLTPQTFLEVLPKLEKAIARKKSRAGSDETEGWIQAAFPFWEGENVANLPVQPAEATNDIVNNILLFPPRSKTLADKGSTVVSGPSESDETALRVIDTPLTTNKIYALGG